jgi:hypothetical protein
MKIFKLAITTIIAIYVFLPAPTTAATLPNASLYTSSNIMLNITTDNIQFHRPGW